MKKNQVLCGLGTLMLAIAPAAHATLLSPPLANLAPGGVSLPPGDDTTDHNGNNPIGTLVASTGVETISNTGAHTAACPTGCTLTGSFISEVYEEAGGTLDFYYQVSIKSGSTSSLEDLNVSDFLASSVLSLNGVNTGDMGSAALLGTSGVPGACGFGANPACTPVTLGGANKGTSAPFGIFYVDDGTGTLDFNFDGTGVKAGKTSLVMAVSTNDTLFELGAASLDGTGGTSEDLFAFEPLSSVPEPVSIVLLGTTLALAALFIRRRHVAKVSKAETES